MSECAIFLDGCCIAKRITSLPNVCWKKNLFDAMLQWILIHLNMCRGFHSKRKWNTFFCIPFFFLYVFILDDWNKDFLFICCLFLVLQNWRRVICVHPFSEWSNKMKWITKCDWWACTIGNMRKIQNFKSWCNCHFSSGNNMKLEREKCNRKNGRQFSGPKMWME